MRLLSSVSSFRHLALWCLLLPILCPSSAVTASSRNATHASSKTKKTHYQPPQGRVVPLIPHHVQQERIRKRRKLSEAEPPLDAGMKRQLEKLRAHYPKRRQLSSSSSYDEEEWMDPEQMAALYVGYGTHYTDIWCGTPPQRQTVIVDTGSGSTSFPCSGCEDDSCGVPDYHIDVQFFEAASSTFEKLDCSECLKGSCQRKGKPDENCYIGMSYQEGSSWYAYEAQDICHIGGLHNGNAMFHDDSTEDEDERERDYDDLDPGHAEQVTVALKFGCQTRLTGLFRTQAADGIMGMEQSKTAFWSQVLHDEFNNDMDTAKFSLCYSRPIPPSVTRIKLGLEAGAMTLGGTDTRLHSTTMVYVPTTDEREFFNVHVRKMYLQLPEGKNQKAKLVHLDASEEQLNYGSVIFDSGTTDTYFVNSIRKPFGDAFKEMVGWKYSQTPIRLTDEQMDALPTIVIQIKGDVDLNKQVRDEHDESTDLPLTGLATDVDPDHPEDVLFFIPPQHYYEWDEDEEKYIGRFYTDESHGSVLGGNAMMGHDVLFDMDNDRVGIAESPCDYTSLLKEYYNVDLISPEGYHPNISGVPEHPGPKEEGNGVFAGVGGTCSSLHCQMGFVLVVVIVIAIVANVLVKRTSSGTGNVSYDDMATSELELQTARVDDDDDEFVQYRDHPSGGLNGNGHDRRVETSTSFESGESFESDGYEDEESNKVT